MLIRLVPVLRVGIILAVDLAKALNSRSIEKYFPAFSAKLINLAEKRMKIEVTSRTVEMQSRRQKEIFEPEAYFFK